MKETVKTYAVTYKEVGGYITHTRYVADKTLGGAHNQVRDLNVISITKVEAPK